MLALAALAVVLLFVVWSSVGGLKSVCDLVAFQEDAGGVSWLDVGRRRPIATLRAAVAGCGIAAFPVVVCYLPVSAALASGVAWYLAVVLVASGVLVLVAAHFAHLAGIMVAARVFLGRSAAIG